MNKRRDAKRQAILDTAYRLFRTQGFDKTSVSQITEEVGGSKATIYNHFPSKEELFVECMTAAAEGYISSLAEQSVSGLDATGSNPGAVLREFGTDFLKFLCAPDIVATRRLMIAEANRAGVGGLFLAKIYELRAHVESILSQFMEGGSLRRDDTRLAAQHLRALLEAEIVEPLLLQARHDTPDDREIALAADRAIAAFLRIYAPSDDKSVGLG